LKDANKQETRIDDNSENKTLIVKSDPTKGIIAAIVVLSLVVLVISLNPKSQERFHSTKDLSTLSFAIQYHGLVVCIGFS